MSSYKNLIGYVVLGAAAIAVGLGLLSAVPENATILAIVLFVPTIVIAPLVLIGVAMLRRSKGYVLGTMAALPFLIAATQAVLWLQVLRIAMYNDRELRAPQVEHRSLLIQNNHHGFQLSDDACDDICRQILLTTSHDVVIESGDGRSWRTFTIGHGADCVRPESVRQYAYLLGRRYLDLCPVGTESARPGDALVVMEGYDTGIMLPQRRPLSSSAIELFERTGGQDTFLGRWAMVAGMQGTLFDPLAISKKGDLAPFGRWGFYGRVLERTIAEHLPVGAATTEDVLVALRPLLDDPEAVKAAMSAFDAMARSNRDRHVLSAFIQSRVSELKSSPNPDPGQLEWCEGWLGRLAQYQPQ